MNMVRAEYHADNCLFQDFPDGPESVRNDLNREASTWIKISALESYNYTGSDLCTAFSTRYDRAGWILRISI